MPLIMALCVVMGILIGTFYTNHFSGNKLSVINSGTGKLGNLIHIIDDQYVDTVNLSDLVEKAIPQILTSLDPHSVYIPAKEAQAASDDLKGSFFGVGIEFVIREDTIQVQNVISGGPAETAGLLAGDKIVTIDDKPFVGKECTTDEAMRRLKGPDKTKVKVGVMRYGSKKVTTYEITRGEVKTHSISSTYMIDDRTGYIRIKNFGENTYSEMLIALAELQQQGFSRLIIDLRDNAGGYLEAAVQMANEFLPKNMLIVYTEGRKSSRQEYKTDGRGSYQKLPLAVLINEASASAAEIFAGAMQDWDRAVVVGRRSFGKGLVQRPFKFEDGSMMRLTVARYYTPSGRCIQKPYEKGNQKDYADDMLHRLKSGELMSADSIHFADSLRYYTLRQRRVVYGGGGIMPDEYVPLDTTKYTRFHRQLAAKGITITQNLRYVDNHRKQLKSDYPAFSEFQQRFEIPESLIEAIVKEGEKQGVKPADDEELRQSLPLMRLQLKALVARDLWSMNEFYTIMNEENDVVRRALQFLNTK